MFIQSRNSKKRPQKKWPKTLGSEPFWLYLLCNQNQSQMAYNIHHSRSSFRLGDKVRVCEGSGLDSGKTGRVVNHFDWTKEQGAYSPPGDDYVPVQYDSGALAYMSKNRLINQSK